ncbi:hypothetical protein BC936DRAFT_149319 [Jimgerdemannia flammicorona]|nr:hypothetical protein BC936DRAFT_149319 [Jimgerdemannia flammicorona]
MARTTRVCRRFRDIIDNPHFKASHLHSRYGRKSLLGGIVKALTSRPRAGSEWMLDEQVVLALISRGADTGVQNDLPLVWAASRGFEAAFECMLKGLVVKPCPDRMQYGWVLIEAQCNRLAMPKYPREMVPADDAAPSGEARSLDRALHAACAGGHVNLVRAILGRGDVRVDSCAGFAIRAGVAGGHVEIVRMLLEAGARLHPDLLPTCLGLVYDEAGLVRDRREKVSESPELQKNHHELFGALLALGAPLLRTGAMLAVMGRRDDVATWKSIELLIGGGHCDVLDVMNMAIMLLVEGRFEPARMMLGWLPRPVPASVEVVAGVVEWAAEPAGTVELNYEVAFAIVSWMLQPQQHAKLMPFLMARDGEGRFRELQAAHPDKEDAWFMTVLEGAGI